MPSERYSAPGSLFVNGNTASELIWASDTAVRLARNAMRKQSHEQHGSYSDGGNLACSGPEMTWLDQGGRSSCEWRISQSAAETAVVVDFAQHSLKIAAHVFDALVTIVR